MIHTVPKHANHFTDRPLRVTVLVQNDSVKHILFIIYSYKSLGHLRILFFSVLKDFEKQAVVIKTPQRLQKCSSIFI